MPSSDRRTFRFQLNGRTAQAHSVGAEHVGLVLPAEGLTSSAIMTVDEAKALCAALQAAITVSENVLPTGLGESVVEVAS